MKRSTSKKDLKAATQNPADTAAAEASFSPWTTDTADTEGLKELTIPPIVKLADMPLQASLDGTVLDVIPSRSKDVKNPLIIISLTKGGNKVTVPAVAAIANVFLPGYDVRENKGPKGTDAKEHCPFLGQRVVIRKAGIRESKKWQDDNKKPRKFPVFDVFVKEAAKARS